MTLDQKGTPVRPKTHSSLADKEMDKAEAQFKEFDNQVKELTLDRMNESPKHEFQPQTEIASIDRAKIKEIFLKPSNSIGCREKFNEKFRKSYEFDKELVHFEAENHEIIGESIELWTRPYPGMPAEFWKIPVNTAVWAPRYVAERIKGCSYHRLVMRQNVGAGSDHQGNQYYGSMAANSTIQRLDARPISTKKSIFMGGNNFS